MPRRLIIVGRGVTAERVAELGGQLGYEELCVVEELLGDVTVEDHVVIAEDDAAAGRELLLSAVRAPVMPAYLGFAASHREGWKALVRLAAEKIAKERIDAVSAPAGVDVGAVTPAEVAIAVAAELIAVQHGRKRPSAGLELTATPARPAAVEARPRRLIGAFGRPRPVEPEVEVERDSDDEDKN